jgi:hypothetical protein
MSDTNIPSWLQDATLKPAPPKKRAVKPEPPAAPRTSAERIAHARAKSIQWSKNSNPFGDHESCWVDYVGDETSLWDAEHWAMFAEMLETPILKTFKYELGNHYDTSTGQYVTKANIPFMSLADLKAAVKARILELGISEPKLWEWFSVPDPDPANDYGRKIHREDLATRILRWRVAAEEVA